MAQYTIPTNTLTGKTSRWNTPSPDWATSGGNIDFGPLAGGPTYSFLSMDDVGSVSGATQILVQGRTTNTAGQNWGAVVNGAIAATEGYFIALTNDIAFMARMDPTNSPTNLDFPSLTMATDTDYWLLVEINTPTLRFKFWGGDYADIPGSWTGSLSDATYTSGYVGLFAHNNNGARNFKFISVGTSGDPAPGPGGASVFTPIIGRGPGMALASRGGGLVG